MSRAVTFVNYDDPIITPRGTVYSRAPWSRAGDIMAGSIQVMNRSTRLRVPDEGSGRSIPRR